MKAASLILTASLAANAALIGVIVLRTPGFDSSAPSEAGNLPPAATGASSAAAGQNLAAVLQTDDPAALRDALRTAGVPEDSIRSIVNNKVWSRYNTRMKELSAARSGSRAYWRGNSEQGLPAEQRAELRELSRAAREQMAGLFGATAETGGSASADPRYDFLPAAKAAQLREIERDYSELRAQVMQDTQGFRTAADIAKLKYLDDEKQRDFDALLTPEERQAYELRNSTTAQRLRSQLAQFDATEAEYRAIYDLQRVFDQKYSVADAMASGVRTFDPESMRTRSDAQKQLQADVKSALGDQRYADYVRAQDQDYRTLQAAATRYNLPQSAIDQVYTTRDTILAASQRIGDDPNMNGDQKRQAISALAAPVRGQILAALGAEVGEAYLKNTGNRWLEGVERGNAVTLIPGGGMSTRGFGGSSRSGSGGRPTSESSSSYSITKPGP